MTNEEYLNLITSEHRGREKFEATVLAGVSPFSKLQTVMLALPADFEIDAAIGVQLDAVGVWVGRSRRIAKPITGVYFTWDNLSSDGWDFGVWKGQFDPDSGLVELPDESYRVLLKAKIAANRWDGTIPGAYDVWANIFGADSELVLQDNQDMTMTIGVSGVSLSSIEKELLFGGYLPLSPAGVRVSYYVFAPGGEKLFAWDIEENAGLAGWDIGSWGEEFSPVSPAIVNPVLVNGFLVTVNGEGVFV